MLTVKEAEKQIPVIDEVDICVLGGSCTGVSAAVRAARLGAKVAIVERLNCFGGNATAGMVCVWHVLYDTEFKKQIIAGTTQEIIDRLKRRKHALHDRQLCSPPYRMSSITNYTLNTEELKIELDEMIREAGVRPYLHTFYSAPWVDDGELKAVIVENKSGRAAIKARFFVDATADGDLCVHLGCQSYSERNKQPSCTSAKLLGYSNVPGARAVIDEHRADYNLPILGWEWFIPGFPEGSHWCRSNVFLDCSDGNELTEAEMEGRRQVRAMMDIVRKHGEGGENITLLAMGSQIGVRETRHIKCAYQLKAEDLLNGKVFEDAIAYSAYPVDIHDEEGELWCYLDGSVERNGVVIKQPEPTGRPTHWQVPFRSLVPGLYDNVVVCGRALDADKGAFAAVRVMVTMNQTGEAAGVAAYEALNSGKGIGSIDIKALRSRMKEGGSIML